MQEALLATKLTIPFIRTELVSRPRLITQLNDGLHPDLGFARKLTLISAAAGFGKTTLVNAWVNSLRATDANNDHNEYKISWLSLDEGDNDPTQFLIYFTTALNQLSGSDATIGQVAMDMLRTPQPPAFEAILTSLINDIATIPSHIVIVLDDYHLIDSRSIDNALTFLLENLPAQLHLVIATRMDPQLPLGRLRARGQLTELRAADLRFTASEATFFLNEIMGLGLSTEDIARLESRTEGWIAGLQLAAISMKGRADVGSLIESFSGSHRFVLDYLLEEVMDQQSQPIQDFLMQTAILNQLTGPLCNALTGQDDGQQTLETLEHANLFVVPLDEERRWYRYHHLFADLLQQYLHRTQPNLVSELHLRAMNWYESKGNLPEAIHHALAADHIENAARLIEQGSLTAIEKSDLGFILKWVEKIPDTTLQDFPWLFIYHTWALLLTGQVEAVSPRLEHTEWLFDSIDDETKKPEMLGFVAGLKAILMLWQRDFSKGIEFVRQAMENLPEDNWGRGYCAIVVGAERWGAGKLSEAKDAFAQAYSIGLAADNVMLAVSSGCNLAHVLENEGYLQDSVEQFQSLFKLAQQDGRELPVAGYIHVDLGRLLYELNELDLAEQHLMRGVHLCKVLADGRAELIGHNFQARVDLARGDLAKVINAIKRGEEANPSPGTAFDLRGGEYPQIRLWITENMLDDLEAWITKEELHIENVSFYKAKMSRTMHARVLITLSEANPDYLNDALDLLDTLLNMAENTGWGSKIIEILGLQAVAYHRQQETEKMLTTIEKALTLAEPERYLRTFVDEGPSMAQVLYEALSHNIAPNYVRRLLAAFSTHDQHEEQPRTSSEADWLESLSEREVEVLEYIAEGLTNAEIADRLYLSAHTIKTHTRNIYSKLDVNSRIQAVSRAQSLGILPAS